MCGCVNMNKKAGNDEHVDRIVRKAIKAWGLVWSVELKILGW